MTPVYQTNYGKDQGNCLTACVASVLDIPITSLPEFCVDNTWFTLLEKFCRENGFTLTYWLHSASAPILCLGAYLIVILNLEGVDTFHCVIGKAVLESVTPDPVSATKLGVSDADRWGWKIELVHDPNERGYPPIKSVFGYILIGKQ